MSAFVSKKYSWRTGFAYSVSAQTVGEVFEEIESRDGKVTAISFLDESRDEASPTHGMFEWNDSVAAEKYRLRQSSAIINQLSVEIVFEKAKPAEDIDIEISTEENASVAQTPVWSRSAYLNVNPKGGVRNSAEFVNVETALSDDIMRKRVLKNAMLELTTFRAKYKDLHELSGVFAEIKKLESEVE